MSTPIQLSSLCILGCPGSIIIVAGYVNQRLLLSPAFSFFVNITGVLKENIFFPVTTSQLVSSLEALFGHHVTRWHPNFIFPSSLTLLVVTSQVMGILKVGGDNTYSFQAQGNALFWGLFVERTFDAVPRR